MDIIERFYTFNDKTEKSKHSMFSNTVSYKAECIR